VLAVTHTSAPGVPVPLPGGPLTGPRVTVLRARFAALTGYAPEEARRRGFRITPLPAG
jgi:hypothetical protein